MDRDELLTLLRALDEEAVDYVLIGATAMRVATPAALHRLS